MILSRVADALYWMGRYLERAENVTRLLLVTEEMATEVLGLDEELARGEWDDVRAIFPGGPGQRAAGPAPGRPRRRHPARALHRSRHPYSVFFSLKKARDNARTVREALTIECFVNLNETYRELEAYNRRRITDPATFRTALAATHRGILSTAGAVEQTLARDPGWLFLKLGESLERVFRTAVVLRVKLPALWPPEPKVDLPLFYSAGAACCAACRRSRTTARCTARGSSRPTRSTSCCSTRTTPRSVRYGTTAVKDVLEQSRAPAASPSPRGSSASSPPSSPTRGKDVLRTGGAWPSSITCSTSWGAPTRRSPPRTSAPSTVLLEIEHRLSFSYDAFIRESFLELRMQPKTTAHETL